jgi:hypothetical protein
VTILLLLTAMALTATSCVLVLRTAAFSRARQRATLAQIDAYGR